MSLQASCLEEAKAGLVSYRPTLLSLLDWAKENRSFKGKPFSLDGHEYLRELYERPFDGYDYLVLEKAAQMGASELAMTEVLWFCDRYPRTKTIYFMPSDELVRDFSHDRIKPVISASPRLSKIVGGVFNDNGIENVGLKHIGHSSLYMRGMFAKSKTKSIPADFIVFDELDEAKRSNKQQAIERLSHSDYQYVLELSTPTLPGYGIDEEWQDTDQRYWHLACRCPEGVVLEDTFPNCVGLRDGRYFLMCPTCGKENLHPCEPARRGEYRGWFPKFPEREKRGYHLTQLFSVYIPLSKIMALWDSGRDREEFYNSKLGMPFAGDRMPLTLDVLRACGGGSYPFIDRREVASDRIFIGADQGLTLHVVVTKEEANGSRRTLWLERISGMNPFNRLSELIERFKPTCTVVDAMPNSVPARELCYKHRNTYRCFYNDTAKDPFNFDLDNRKVNANRTHMLDQMVQDWQQRKYVVPDDRPEVEVAFAHLRSLAKLLETNPDTGISRWVYKHLGEDHYAHAYNYERIAASYPYGRCDFSMI
jgi:hypothetical protein